MNASDWIPVKLDKPELEVSVLALLGTYSMRSAVYSKIGQEKDGGDICSWISSSDGTPIDTPTHWAPLPPPPIVENDPLYLAGAVSAFEAIRLVVDRARQAGHPMGDQKIIEVCTEMASGYSSPAAPAGE